MNDSSLREAPLLFSSSLAEGHNERQRDTLNLLPYAEALRDFIQECDTPMTIGIQGDWGIGKTSLMNMLRGVEADDASGLLNDEQCQVVNFETWPYSQFNSGNDLVIACMHALTSKVEEALEDEGLDAAQLQAAANQASSKLREVQRHVRAGTTADLTSAADDQPHQDISTLMIGFRREFRELVDFWVGRDAGRRVVVFVDDLDRVHPSEALLLLEAIKNFVDVPGCVFVLAVDFEVVQKGMAEKLGRDMQRTSGKAFYDKIIQLPFVMPTASYQLEPYIVGLLKRSGFPYSEEMVNNPVSRDYFLNITLCTVGRNPRNIKRVMNYANLLERVREHQGGGPISPRDAQILFALISMQIAWPELFSHFVNDPTVDTVTSLQNWEFLDRLPEAQHLFEREVDQERIKINIGTFFDTLFSLLDENNDGQIDSRELEPVLDVMQLASMTSVESRERPRDWFIQKVRDNNVDNDPLIESFLEKVFMKSVWYLGSDCRYRKSGTRFITLVYHGRQIGSLVSLPSQPFVFRLMLAPERVRAGLKAYWKGKGSMDKEAITFTREVFGKEASLTGFGDTVVDFSRMTNMRSSEAVNLLNSLYRIAISDDG
jgi:hypothetical protein